MTPSQPSSLQQRQLLRALWCAVFMVNLDARVVSPLLPTLADELHVSLSQAGWVVSAYMLPYGLFQLAFGPLANRYGKMNVCSWAMLAFGAGTACCSLWPSFTAILVLRALTGAAAAGLIPLTLAYVGDTVPYERRQATIAGLMAGGGAAQAFSTGAGGTLATLFSWRAVFPCLGVLACLNAWALFRYRSAEVRVVRDGARAQLGFRSLLRGPLLVLLLLVGTEGFLFMGGFSFLSGLLEARFALSPLHIGLIMSLAGVSQLTAARLLLPRLLPRFGERAMLGAGAGCMALGYLVSAAAGQVWLVAFACAVLGAGFIFFHTTLQTRVTEIAPTARGNAVALFAFSLFLGAGTGTALIGLALDRVGFKLGYAVVGTLLIALGAAAVRVIRPLGTNVDSAAAISLELPG